MAQGARAALAGGVGRGRTRCVRDQGTFSAVAAGAALVRARGARARRARGAETLRAEEIELSVPDGRSVATLVSATPIHAADGTVESVVVTMQDLAPLEELERLRAEFLDMVSHELRAPLTSIKGAAATLLETSSTLDRAEMREFFRIIVEQTDHMRGRIDTGTLSVAPEPTEVATFVDRARSTFLRGSSGHNVLIDSARSPPRRGRPAGAGVRRPASPSPSAPRGSFRPRRRFARRCSRKPSGDPPWRCRIRPFRLASRAHDRCAPACAWAGPQAHPTRLREGAHP